MLPTATIVFREILEVALVLTIVLAATRGMNGRLSMVLSGLGLGILGASVIAFFTDAISSAMEGMGQEIFNAGIMFIAVGFLSWTVIWMKRHGREMAQNIKAVGQDVMSGNKPVYALVAIIALATFREGAEIVLFSYGMMASGAFGLSSILAGAALGLVGGTIVGLMIYFGLLKAAQRHLITVTSWMLIILTAGMAAHGAGFLIAAGVLPELGGQLWDTSHIISGHSFIGETLSVLIGYTPRPTGMEVLFYVGVIVVVGGLYRLISSAPQKPQVTQSSMPMAAE